MGLFSKKKKDEENVSVSELNEDPISAENEDDDLIAVIAAAISAYEAEQFVQTLYIKKLNRTAGIRPIWGATGTNEAIDVRRI